MSDLPPASHDEQPPEPVRVIRLELSLQSIALVICALVACFIGLRLLPVVLALVLALLLVGTLNPAIGLLERWHLKRTPAVLVTFGLLFVVGAGLTILTLAPLISQAQSLVAHEPELRNRFAAALAKSEYTAGFATRLRELKYDSLAASVASSMLTASTQVAGSVAYAISAVFLAAYILIDRDRLQGGLFAVVPRVYHIRMARVLLNLETIVGGYIRGQALTCALMAGVTWILLTACRVPNALALSMFAGVADLLPYVGAMLAVGPAALVASTQGLTTVLVVVATMLAYQELESRVIVPRVYGQVLRLPSSIVLVSLLAGGALMGILGALLALPAAAAIRMLLLAFRTSMPGEHIDDARWRARDERAERQYAERAGTVPAKQAARIALQISEQRLRQEGDRAIEVPMTPGESRSH